jgi:hypothetical protein
MTTVFSNNPKARVRSDMGTLKGFPCPPTMVRHARRWLSRRAPHATRTRFPGEEVRSIPCP